MGDTMFGDLASVRDGLKDVDYLADDGIARSEEHTSELQSQD